MKTWLIILALVILTMANQKEIKKESKFSFRCSEDNTAIEIYNKDTNSFTVWQQCEGECVEGDTIHCTVPEQAKQASPISPLPVLLILGGLLYWRYKR